MNNVYTVILAGGVGERLWPLSGPTRPKQLIPFINNKSLLGYTLMRAQQLTPDADHRLVVTNEAIAPAVQELVGDQAHLIVEPAVKNTAPAILLACLQLVKTNPDAVVAILPADHFIPDTQTFIRSMEEALFTAKSSDGVVLVGIKPTYPATGYGYIQYSTNKQVSTGFVVKRFCEKPDLQKAELFASSEDMLWNIGIVVARAEIIIEECRVLQPALYKAMLAYLAGNGSYHAFEQISFDYAILEKTDRALVIPATFTWSDVGSIAVFLSIQRQHQKQSAHVIQVDAMGNYVSTTKKVVAFVGVDNLCVVETEDALLIVPASHTEQVRQVVRELEAQTG